MKKICNECNTEQSSHFFYEGVCIHCAVKAGARAGVKTKKDYEEVEDKGCAGGACTL